MVVADVLNKRPGATVQTAVDALTNLILGFPSPLLVPGPARSQVEQAAALNPTTIFVWIGSNDILLSVLAGDPSMLTPLANFANSYVTMMTALAKTNARLIVANIPDVTVRHRHADRTDRRRNGTAAGPGDEDAGRRAARLPASGRAAAGIPDLAGQGHGAASGIVPGEYSWAAGDFGPVRVHGAASGGDPPQCGPLQPGDCGLRGGVSRNAGEYARRHRQSCGQRKRRERAALDHGFSGRPDLT